MVLIVMAVAATLAVPAFSRLGTEQPSKGADQVLGLLRDARKAAFDFNATVTLRLDPNLRCDGIWGRQSSGIHAVILATQTSNCDVCATRGPGSEFTFAI